LLTVYKSRSTVKLTCVRQLYRLISFIDSVKSCFLFFFFLKSKTILWTRFLVSLYILYCRNYLFCAWENRFGESLLTSPSVRVRTYFIWYVVYYILYYTYARFHGFSDDVLFFSSLKLPNESKLFSYTTRSNTLTHGYA